ncbi:MAG: hypothetical protein PWQ22_1689 [Archaeoglobaceae archaeon]|nr:hypothetical protein [Archaeoglobaceae archaeon]
MNLKGVSEVVSYIFIFGIVLTTVAYAYVHISGIVKDVSEKYKIEGLRESFKRIQNVFFLSTYGGSVAQEIQIELQGGNLYVSDSPLVNVTIEPAGISYNGRLASVSFRQGDYRITIENGAVFEDYYGYHRTVVDPRIFLQKSEIKRVSGEKEDILVAVFYIVNGNFSLSGYGPVKLTFQSRLNKSYLINESGTMTIEISSDFSDRWKEHFERMGANVSLDGNKVKATLSFDEAVVTIFEVNVSTKLLT